VHVVSASKVSHLDIAGMNTVTIQCQNNGIYKVIKKSLCT
jgi:hypothetical protein